MLISKTLRNCTLLFLSTLITTSYGNKVAFVTGGASGIGAATITTFIEQGIKVGFLDCNSQAGNSFIKNFSDEDILFIPGDVSKVSNIKKAINATIEKFDHIDIVFANAGIHHMQNLLDLTEEDWQTIIDINLKGAVFTVKEALPHLIKNKGGSIIINCSDQSFIAKSNMPAYGLTKAALAQFTKSTALDFGAFNIRVNAICPATIRTPLAEGVMQQWAATDFQNDVEKAWKVEAEKYPLKRYGTCQEVANLVYFLASDASSFMTGGTYLIDGGLTIY